MAPSATTTNDEKLLGHAPSDYPPDKPYSVGIKEYPVTLERKAWVPPNEDNPLPDAGTARATYAPSKEMPYGTTDGDYAKKNSRTAVIVQHVAYWDPDNDGVIWPIDTYRGCRDFGWGIILSFYATLLINGALSYPTVPGIFPDPFFRLFTARMYKAKHGSDSMSYDNEGRFRPQAFEDLFEKYDRGHKGGLDKSDLWRAWRGQMLVFDLFGWAAVFFEWLAVYLLLWPDDGILRKEDVRGIFDGSIFFKKRDETQRKRAEKKQARQEKQELEMKSR
ncbi:MAG: hypothetical protein M1817_000493 [Caeruleum heppii]|nr:MAG: hypothetical protein M1817_000493 [Caeruleum heppii]